MFSTKQIWVLRILEYSTILLLEYFEDSQANVVLPEAWLEWLSNDVTQIRNKPVKRESDWIGKTEPNPVETVS